MGVVLTGIDAHRRLLCEVGFVEAEQDRAAQGGCGGVGVGEAAVGVRDTAAEEGALLLGGVGVVVVVVGVVIVVVLVVVGLAWPLLTRLDSAVLLEPGDMSSTARVSS